MNKKRWGATPQDWQKFTDIGLTEDLLPVVSNPDAPIAPTSKMKTLGKTPSQYNDRAQIVGIGQWTQKKAHPREIESWKEEPDYGICLQTRRVRALDIDVDDKKTAAKIIRLITMQFDKKPPVRFREDSGKCLFPFWLQGEYSKRTVKLDGGMIEFLATGQQFIAAGTHPKGARYKWDWNDHDNFPTLTADEFANLWLALCEEFGTEAPTERKNKSRKYTYDGEHSDDTAKFLIEKGHAIGTGRDGQVFIECPFSAGHTTEDNGTSTAYFPAGSGGYARGHFVCLHASCAHRHDDDFLDAYGLREKDFEVIASDEEEKATEQRFKIIPVHEFINGTPPTWRIHGILPENGLAMFYGASGSGKSFFAIDIAMAIALGKDWNGHKTKAGKVLYIAAEGASGIINRIKAYSHHHNINLSKIPLGFIKDCPDFRTNDDSTIIKRIENDGGADIVFIDTFAQVSAGIDENQGKDVSAVLKRCQNIQEKTGGLVILIHHTGKDENKGSRGWSGLKAPLDTEIYINSDKEGKRTVALTKQKDGKDGLKFSFVLKPVVIGIDEDGEDIESCIVEYRDIEPQTRKISGPVQKVVYEAARTLFEILGTPIEVSDIIAHSITLKNDCRKDSLKRALDSLVRSHNLSEIDGKIIPSTEHNDPQN